MTTPRSVSLLSCALLILCIQNTASFTPASVFKAKTNSQQAISSLWSATNPENENPTSSPSLASLSTRSTFIRHATAAITTTILINSPQSATALVKGNAPPPKKSPSSSENNKIQCTNVEECQEKADRLLAQERLQQEKAESELSPDERVSKAPLGSRYRDLSRGDIASPTIATGDTVDIYYKVLKLGKRSYDGLSGEGTVVFSRGYGLEDDEDPKGNNKPFRCTVGSSQLIAALSDALPGMHLGTVRRISVSPQMGWETPSKDCDGGPGGKGAGGEIRTDYVVVPTATMVSTESCFDKEKIPFPNNYAQQRRMAQRFDQSLIMEVEMVQILNK